MKVQRPNLHATISFDIVVLYKLVTLTNRFFPGQTRTLIGKACCGSFRSLSLRRWITPAKAGMRIASVRVLDRGGL